MIGIRRSDQYDDDTESFLFTIVTVFSVISIFANVLAGVATIYVWNARMIQHTQPILTMIQLLGTILLCFSCFFLLGRNTETNCAIRVYLFNLSLTLAFCPNIIKVMKVYFSLVLTFSIRSVNGSSYVFQSISNVVFIFIDILIIPLTLYVNGSGTFPVNYDGDTYCGYYDNRALFVTEVAYKCLMLIILWYFASAIRIVNTKFSNILFVDSVTKALVGVTMFLVWLYLPNHSTAIICVTAGISFCAIVFALLTVIPVAMVLIMGDREAIEVVVEDMFEIRKALKEVRCISPPHHYSPLTHWLFFITSRSSFSK